MSLPGDPYLPPGCTSRDCDPGDAGRCPRCGSLNTGDMGDGPSCGSCDAEWDADTSELIEVDNG